MDDLSLNTIFFGTVALGIGAAVWFYMRLKLLFLYRLAAQKSLKLPQKAKTFFFYSSWAIKQECVDKFFCLSPNKETTVLLLLMKNFNKGKTQLSRLIKAYPNNYRFRLILAEAERVAGNSEVARRLVQEIKLPFFVSSYWKALFFHLEALVALYNTDMLTASQYASLSLKLYQKKGFTLEEAGVYMTLSHIYRISGVFDTAVMMLKEAQKLYQASEVSLGEAEALAYLGVVEMMRENHQAAGEYLDAAAKLAQSKKMVSLLADIENRRGLNAYLNKEFNQAEAYFKQACQVEALPRAKAFACEMLARMALQNKKFTKALKYVRQALSYVLEAGEKFENLYLLAEIHYQQGELQQSRQILTELIKKKSLPSALWYPANAYTLLGLIELKENNLSQAKNLFKKAVDMEHGRNRLKGAAIDYNNLAELCRREGEEAEASLYLTQALLYAEQTGDTELQTYLKAKLSN